MKKIILIVLFGLPAFAHAGLLSFLGDVASISSAMDSGQAPVSHDDMKKVNKYLWAMVKEKQYVEGYELLAEVLETSNNVSYIETAARAYFDNGKKDKAIELYERKVLPLARAFNDKGYYEKTYRMIKGIGENEKIPYAQIYNEKKKRQKELIDASKSETKKPSFEYAVWGILLTLLLNLIVNLISLFKTNYSSYNR